MFEFLRVQYALDNIDEVYLDRMVSKGRITEEEKNLIISSKSLQK